MILGLVDAANNLLKSVKIKQDEKYTNRYEVAEKYSAANEYMEPRHINDCNERTKCSEQKSQQPRYYKGNAYKDNATHTEIHGDVNVSITITGNITCGRLSDICDGIDFDCNVNRGHNHKSYSEYISDKNDKRDEIYRDSLQRFYKYNMF